MIVVDASVLAVALIGDGPDGTRAREVLKSAQAVSVPDLANVETLAVLSKRWIDNTIGDQQFEEAVHDLGDLPMQHFAARPFIERARELRANVSAYDAMYVALAEALDCPLVTSDAKLAASPGPTCTFNVLSHA